MHSEATTVEAYLDELPADRRGAIETAYPDTYNGKPLMHAALASQKRHMAVYLTAIYTADAIAAYPPKTFIERHEEARAQARAKRS